MHSPLNSCPVIYFTSIVQLRAYKRAYLSGDINGGECEWSVILDNCIAPAREALRISFVVGCRALQVCKYSVSLGHVKHVCIISKAVGLLYAIAALLFPVNLCYV